MSERITRADLDRIAGSVSESFTSGLHLVVQGRNGNTCLDLYDADGCVDNLRIGTAREVYTYLQGMRRTLMIVGRSVAA